MAALKAFHVSDVPNLDQVPDNVATRFSPPPPAAAPPAAAATPLSFKAPKFLVIGHRGNGMNMVQSSSPRDHHHQYDHDHDHDERSKSKSRSSSKSTTIMENTISSFHAASTFPIDYIEFDVQVTKDDCPIIFHDNFIFSQDNGTIYEKRVTELSRSELQSYGSQKEPGKVGKPLFRKTKDGKILSWNVETDDSLCTLQEALEKVNPALGFNIELKFDDNVVYQQDHLTHVLKAILQVVFDHAKDRPIIFSSFEPDAALLVRKLQNTYPVFFLTNGGNEIFYDVRRNTLEDAIALCLEGGLQGIVSEVRGIFRNPGAVSKIKEAKLSLLTYGKLNNVTEAVYMQHLMGVEGVIVDYVQEITEAVSDMVKPSNEKCGEKEIVMEGEKQIKVEAKPQFSQRELSFLLKLIPELIQQ